MRQPYIFRGALDVRASAINIDMKIAATKALADLAKQDVPDEVSSAYAGQKLQFGPDYIIPKPFDPRLLTSIPPAVARAAEKTGVARKPIIDELGYRRKLAARLDRTATLIQKVADTVIASPKKIVFAEGEQETVIRAAVQFYKEGYGQPILVGREDVVKQTMKKIGINKTDEGIVGDVAFDEVSKNAKALTPVPGGVGPMTIACLLKNTIDCFKRSQI